MRPDHAADAQPGLRLGAQLLGIGTIGHRPDAYASARAVIGIDRLGEGGKATLYVPSELGYGERGSNGIDPNTTLVFDIQLDSVKRFVEPVVEDKK